MTRRRLGGPRGLSELMGATLGTAKLARGVGRARALLLWPQAVGPEIARMTRPRSQQGGTLYVEVRDSTTAHHLTMQRHHFLKRLNAMLAEGNGRPEDAVRELRFSVGTVRAPENTPRAAPLPAPDRARARQLVQEVADPELRQAALRAAEAVTRARRWREEQGWRPCPVCGERCPAPTRLPGEAPPPEAPPCRACALTLEDPNVRRAARVVARTPERLDALETTLGGSGRLAARYLALELLDDQLGLLALECVRSGGENNYLSFLRAQAETYLMLKLGKARGDLRRADHAALPERVRQVLAAGQP